MQTKHQQTLRMFFALIISVLYILGFVGIYYPIKISNLNLAPLIQHCFVSLSIGFGLLLIFIILLTLIFGRIYCSTLCPLGLFQELCCFIFHRKKNSISRNLVLKYFIAAIAFGTLFGGTSYVLHWVDPYTIFGSAISGTSWGIYGLIFLAILVFFKKRYFCTNICPIGTILGLFSRHAYYKITINKDSCVACGLCAQKCPAECIDYKNKQINNETCLKCLKCLNLCHNNGISYTHIKNPQQPYKEPNKSRRKFLIQGASLLTLVIAYKAGINFSKNIAKKIKDYILPPGAGSTEKFINTCLNCNLCVQNCPSKIIQKADKDFPTVHIKYGKNSCLYDCHKCSDICPSGALKNLSLKQKQKTQIALAVIDENICIKCGICAMECPHKSITKNVGEFPLINSKKCIGCGACRIACPVSAIKIKPINPQKYLGKEKL